MPEDDLDYLGWDALALGREGQQVLQLIQTASTVAQPIISQQQIATVLRDSTRIVDEATQAGRIVPPSLQQIAELGRRFGALPEDFSALRHLVPPGPPPGFVPPPPMPKFAPPPLVSPPQPTFLPPLPHLLPPHAAFAHVLETIRRVEVWRPRAMFIVPALEWAARTAERVREQVVRAKHGLCEGALATALHAKDVAAMQVFTRDRVHLPPSYWPEVVMALSEGRWRNVSDPLAYIRRVAWLSKRKVERSHRKSLANTNDNGAEEIRGAVHGEPLDYHGLFEVLHDSPFEPEELELLHANKVVRVPYRAIPDWLGDRWNSKRVERVRRRVTRKLEAIKSVPTTHDQPDRR